jgi:hypothetical protein
MSIATNDTHPAVTADSGPPSGPGLTLAPVSSLTRQPACHLPAGERDRAQPCWIRRCGALTGLDHVAATPADTALRAPPISKTLRISLPNICAPLVEWVVVRGHADRQLGAHPRRTPSVVAIRDSVRAVGAATPASRQHRRDTGKQLSPAIAGRTAPEPAA